MRKLIIWNVITLDGYFEGEKPWDLSFHELVWGPELEALSLSQLEEADMLVFGKDTYVGMASYWQSAQEEGNIADLMNSMPKVVCTTSLMKAEWHNTSIIRNAVSELKSMKEKGENPMYIFGSGKLSQSLLQAGMIDEIRICIAPVLLGRGTRLFAGDTVQHQLKLLESRPLLNGGVVLRYTMQNIISTS